MKEMNKIIQTVSHCLMFLLQDCVPAVPSAQKYRRLLACYGLITVNPNDLRCHIFDRYIDIFGYVCCPIPNLGPSS